MELAALYKRVIGLDIHQAQITACALLEEPDGTMRIEQRQFGGFKRDRRELAHWVASLKPEEVVMESTGIYWKSPYAALEAVGIRAKVVNARHVKHVPGMPQVSTRHANFIINRGKATAADILKLAGHVRQTVREKFNIRLETEVQIVGN